MKKFFAKLMTGLLAAICLVSICACAPKPSLDFDKAKSALESRGYEVEVSDHYDGDYAEAIEEYLYAYDEDYDEVTIIKFEKAAMAKKFYKSIKAEVDTELEYCEAQVAAMEYFLKHYEDKLSSEEIDEYEDDIKEYNEEIEYLKEDYTVGRSGKYVWFGDKSAVEDAKK